MCPRSHKPLMADLDPELRTPDSQSGSLSTSMHMPTGLGEIRIHSKIFTPSWDRQGRPSESFNDFPEVPK